MVFGQQVQAKDGGQIEGEGKQGDRKFQTVLPGEQRQLNPALRRQKAQCRSPGNARGIFGLQKGPQAQKKDQGRDSGFDIPQVV